MAPADAVVDRFRSWLRDRGLPVTAQRIAIAEVLFEADRHLSAEEIAAELSGRGSKVGTATVYRTIDVLLESGLVVERDFGEGFRRFESARDVPQHEHVLCTGCGRVEEFRDDRIERIASELAESRGFARERHRLVIYGRCRSCRAAGSSVSPSNA
jgi:Fur family ferric uptake transcriptional regulator